MIATTIEQSKHLLELGLDPDTADMYYTGHRSIFNPKEIEYTQEPRVRAKFVSFDRLEVFFPAWSLSALLEVMPMNINDYDLYITKHKYVDGGYAYNIEYNRGFTISVLHKETNRNVITAAFEMVKWLLEQKILTFSGNEKDCS